MPVDCHISLYARENFISFAIFYSAIVANIQKIHTFALLTDTVRLVQLVEHQIVVLGVVGSSPTSHPKKPAFSKVGFFFVEMPGVEPGSKQSSKKLSTRLSFL